ncbi:MAG: HlyD family type I secretion periplasmic adaptor subunit [Hyphococcus sp.]|nr:MAG: HlyD family type I secretion periplasmic adaptor subunit [Marinicaulis sp.]
MNQNNQLAPLDIDVDEAMPIEPVKAAQYLLYIIAGLFITTFVWASVAKLDRVTRGLGKVVTSNQLQELQYFEGGIVKEILVSAGDKVEAGQVLVRLDPTQMNVEFTQGREEYNLLAARIVRLEAEAALKPLAFPPELVNASPRIVSNERALFEARQAEMQAALSVEKNKLAQKEEAQKDAAVSFETAGEAFAFASQELQMMRRLVEKGIEPRVEMLRAQQREAAARGEKQRSEIAVNRSALEVEEAAGEIDRIEKTFTATAVDELNKAKAELEDLKGELPALEDKVARTEVRAPVAGTVNRVLVSTIGGVVPPGETIAEIVPSEDALLVEARIKQADIGFLSLGQEAKVSITAYDSSVYGSAKGVIEKISPDAIEDEKTGELFYKIVVRTDSDSLESKRGNLNIMPGMAAEVAVLNGKRTVLAYIMKPLATIGDKALQDK